MIRKLNKYLKIGIIGLGYVGLPLTVAFSKKFDVRGFDINKKRIRNIKLNKDIFEVEKKDIKKMKSLKVSHDISFLKECNIFILTVPTPLLKNNNPDLNMLINATKKVSEIIKPNDLIIFESTVFPGTTEEICIPILERNSRLKLYNKNLKTNKIFYCGYSPERINPTDRTHTVYNTNKIVSGNDARVTKFIKNLYQKIIKAKVFAAKSIKVAEASKMIENIQRDLNIALINELSIIFNKQGIKTLDVLKAASTKWNFSEFYPGLVGGHCIGVDPYYMAYKAKKLNVKSDLILGGRKINDKMPFYVAKKFFNLLKKLKHRRTNKILIMGVTFKENCPDVRNSKVMDIYKYLKKKKFSIDLFDPVANSKEFFSIYKKRLLNKLKSNTYDGIIIAVRHNIFKNLGLKKIKSYGKKRTIIFDLKTIFPKDKSHFNL